MTPVFKRLSIVCVCFLIPLISVCTKQPSNNNTDTTPYYDWTAASPETQGFDGIQFTNAVNQLDDLEFLTSLLVVRNEYLVLERYFQSFTQDDYQPVMSITKSIISTLVGIAIEEGLIDSVNQAVLDFYQEYVTPSMDPRKHDITIAHLLTMQSGMEGDYILDGFYLSQDWMETALKLDLLFDPGTGYCYTDYGVHLLSGIIAKMSGMSTLDFAKQVLGEPLGIDFPLWEQDRGDIYMGGAGLFLYPRDMARLGYLYLNDGLVDSRVVIPSEWISKTFQKYLLFEDWRGLTSVGYGYLWWLGDLGEYETFSAFGMGGQLIMIIPDLDLVIVATSDLQRPGYEEHMGYILNWINDHLFTSVIE